MEATGPSGDPAQRTYFGARAARIGDEIGSQVAFLGVPYDDGTPEEGIPKGQREGPAAIREAGVAILDGESGWYDVETDTDHLVGVTMADCGDVAIEDSPGSGNFDRITEAAARIAGQALLVAVGGDHSISYPLGRGVAEVAGDLDVVHIDAHADFYEDLDGDPFTGASQLRRLSELPAVGSVSAIGLRNADRAEVEGIRGSGGSWATSRDVIEQGPANVIESAVPESRPLYVSIDLDVLDSSIAPGHSLTEPGGLTYRQLRAILEEVARRGRVVAFDVAEMNPSRDPSGATARVAAWTIVHFLSAIFDQRR